MFDALVIGSGPAGLVIAAALCSRGLRVQGLTPTAPTAVWPNTYGIWRDELESLGLTDLLAHSWSNCVSYFAQGQVNHHRSYGLFDKEKLQMYLLNQCSQGQMVWHQGSAAIIKHQGDHSCVTTQQGVDLQARVVIDTSGHQPVFVQRSLSHAVAFQVAYGIVGRFSSPPIPPGQFVLMDYRSDHLSPQEASQYPPTFLYAMDLGDGVFFVEETSLAAAPAVPFEALKTRLHQRLQARGVTVTEIQEVEHCRFPMNLPMPDLQQPVVGFGGAASMVHPASGYMVGALLRRSPEVAAAIAQALDTPMATPITVAQAAWQALWPQDRLRKYYLYRFGLEKLMRFEEDQLQHFFDTFFSLPTTQWSGFLADTMMTPELVLAMLKLFGQAPNDVRWGLMRFAGQEGRLLWRSLMA